MRSEEKFRLYTVSHSQEPLEFYRITNCAVDNVFRERITTLFMSVDVNPCHDLFARVRKLEKCGYRVMNAVSEVKEY